uniref:Uncharacterized protein n=1 Tax=Arion vulgaris TaxID=1028688 RepID=A0A0B7A8D7_9EUPU
MNAENQPKIYQQVKGLKESGGDDDETMSIPYGGNSWKDTKPPKKIATGNWLNVFNADVAKRQTLSINNALMALTDMVKEHSREKLMRNRDNLRYHMYVQG